MLALREALAAYRDGWARVCQAPRILVLLAGATILVTAAGLDGAPASRPLRPRRLRAARHRADGRRHRRGPRRQRRDQPPRRRVGALAAVAPRRDRRRLPDRRRHGPLRAAAAARCPHVLGRVRRAGVPPDPAERDRRRAVHRAHRRARPGAGRDRHRRPRRRRPGARRDDAVGARARPARSLPRRGRSRCSPRPTSAGCGWSSSAGTAPCSRSRPARASPGGTGRRSSSSTRRCSPPPGSPGRCVSAAELWLEPGVGLARLLDAIQVGAAITAALVSAAAATSLFQAALAHASYVAPPRLVWPDSPAIETLGERPERKLRPRRDFPPAV